MVKLMGKLTVFQHLKVIVVNDGKTHGFTGVEEKIDLGNLNDP